MLRLHDLFCAPKVTKNRLGLRSFRNLSCLQRVGGAGVTIGAIRVTFWGALAMAVTAGVGWLFGTVA
jgi:hypothetical protein